MVDVGWRSTRVRMLANNVVIVPNKRVAESIITNYDMPERRMALLLPVSVGYDSDPDRVEAVLVDVAVAGGPRGAGPARRAGLNDYLYVTNWTLWGDVKLLMKTLPAVVRGHGAY